MSRRTLIALLVACLFSGCREAPAPSADKAILILISVDGFRWDYLDRFEPPTLTRLAAEGVRADGLIPEFPSTTFPNHYTIVTGQRVVTHGIISNNMRARDIPGEFAMSNRGVLADPRWWGGEPIWNTAEKQGKKASAMFWPGSETVIDGRQATYWMPFDDDMPNAERVKRTLGWLKLPENQRPSFLTLYFSDVDSTGHTYGPDSDEVRNAVLSIDKEIGDLVNGVREAGLADRVNYVVVSDHGMAALSTDRVIVLDDYIDVGAMDIIDWSPLLALAPNDGDIEKAYAALKGKHPALDVYRSAELPAELRLANHPRLPPIVGIAKEGWYITSRRNVQRWSEPGRRAPGGAHGYDVRAQSMQGLFVAAGPRIRHGLRFKPLENIQLYEFMCAVIGLRPAKNDGNPAATRDMLRSIQ